MKIFFSIGKVFLICGIAYAVKIESLLLLALTCFTYVVWDLYNQRNQK
jgi:hypothetical protein